MQISTDIYGFFVLILAAFTLGSTFLSAYSILNAVRLRHVRLSWKAGKLGGYPLFATIFLLTAVVLCTVVYQQSLGQYYTITGCYAWIGMNWFIASYLASKRFITDHGIVKNINDPSQTVAWFQMTDFVVKLAGREEESGDRNNNGDRDYIFIYQNCDRDEKFTSACVRLELKVPAHKHDEFKKIVSYKLGQTISPEYSSLTDAGAVN